MRLLGRLFFIFSVFLLFSCSKRDFVLTFNLPEDLSVNYNVIYYASSKEGGMTVQAVASVQSGKCELKGITRLPTMIYITEKAREIPLALYAEAGDKIEITGEGRSPLDWKVGGNQINATLTSWRLEYADTLKRKDNKEINHDVSQFVRENPSDQASTVLLMTYYDRQENEREFAELFASLKGPAKKESWLAVMARADQLIPSVSYPARLQSMVMKSALNKSDTVRPDSSQVVMLFFWQNGMNQRKEFFDSIKTLRKEFKDSTKYQIADISLDADSTSWRGPLRRDSLEGVARLWASAGLADRDVMKLKVTNVPYFIVFDSLGNQTYRGADITLAIEEFRNLANEKESVKP